MGWSGVANWAGMKWVCNQQPSIAPKTINLDFETKELMWEMDNDYITESKVLVESFWSGQRETRVAKDSSSDEVIKLAPAEESTFYRNQLQH